MDAYLETIATAGGPITIAVNSVGALIQLNFGDGSYPRSIDEDLRQAGYTLHAATRQAIQARREIEEYWAGTRRVFEVPLVLRGTPWQTEVWQALTQIPFGATHTYGSLAALLGHPRSSRAVGRANATNRIPLVVPCHRLVGANGSLTGFAGGIHLKQRLLDHEHLCVDSGVRYASVG
ncbi:MAG: methylated-DNA--[protein]-cysteine S-methyltransferase [Roseiflexaceae bacterium]|nr:methylated-DNA--[protein]-cysteine S-methyltransferase [Roseiflexaceae bacterium]